jgi:hypothetical protein
MYITNDSILNSPAQAFVFFLDEDSHVILEDDKDYLLDMFPSLRFICTRSIIVKNPVYTIIVIRKLEELDTYLDIYHHIAVYVPENISEIELFKYATVDDLFFHVSCKQYSNLVYFYGVLRNAAG